MTKLDGKTPPDAKLEKLIEEINLDFAETAASTGASSMSSAVERAMRTVPRVQFVPEENKHFAYGNFPLPIGFGQTISQPFIVALMTELLQLDNSSKVLEIGTGCGYQTAILAEIAKQVYSVEIVSELGEAAFVRLQELGYKNIHYRSDDGSLGWPQAAPFDGIIVTACGDESVPKRLLDQLAIGGRMVIPVETHFGQQELTVISKNSDGTVDTKNVLGVRFVPITH